MINQTAWVDSSPTTADPVVLDTRVVTESGGGPDKTILNSPRFFASEGYRMLCAYMHPPGDPGFESLKLKAQQWGAPLSSIPDRGPWDWRVASQMLRLCRNEQVTIWHGHDYKSNAIGLALRPFHRMRLVTTVHGWVKQTQRTPLYYAIDRLCLPRYERVICVSADLMERCLAIGVPEKRCVLIENGIDTEDYRRTLDPAEAKQRMGIPPERLVIGAVGRLSAEKGFDLLIKAADRLLADGLDFELLIVGDGDQAGPLRELIGTLGREDRIRLLGYRADTISIYQAMDLFVLSSLREGLPNVVLEAMSMEVPVVATRIAGVPHLIRDGENGILIEPGAVAPLTESIASLLRNRDAREQLGQEGRRTVESGYSFRTRIQKLRALYDELLQPSP